jgi:enoyl-CoA hydratase/carnithine racemase
MPFEGIVDREKLPHPERVIVTVDGHVATIELNEPEKLNPLNTNELHIHFALKELHANPDVRVVILTGRGRGFCAGRDLRTPDAGPNPHDGTDWTSAQRLVYGYAFGSTMWETLHNFPKPLIAAVNGFALGGGWELAHLCDWIIAADSAVFGAVEIDVGVLPFAGTCTYLPRMVGKHMAMDLIVNGTKISAQEALELRLINQVVPRDELMAQARALADRIAARPPVAVAAIKQLVGKSMDTFENYKLERALAYFIMTMEDTKAAGTAMVRKEPLPEFYGR